MNLNPREPGEVCPTPNPSFPISHFKRAREVCAPARPWFLLHQKRKRGLTLQGNGAPGTPGHVLREPGAGELQPQRPRRARPARVTVPDPLSPAVARHHVTARGGRAPPPPAYLKPHDGSRAWLRCARSCPSVGSASGISTGQVLFCSRTRSFMAAAVGPGGPDAVAATVTTARRRARSGNHRSRRSAEEQRSEGPATAPAGRSLELERPAPLLRAPPGAHPASGRLAACANPGRWASCDR